MTPAAPSRGGPRLLLAVVVWLAVALLTSTTHLPAAGASPGAPATGSAAPPAPTESGLVEEANARGSVPVIVEVAGAPS